MLRVEAGRFARRDPEESGVDHVCVRHEAAPARHHPSWRSAVRMMETRRIPAFRRHFGDGVASLAQQLPKGARIIHAARKTAGHSDNGERFLRKHLPGIRTQSSG